MNELNAKVGDKLLYRWGYSHNRVEKIVTVTRVTPTGRIRIDYNDEQYDKYGNKIGKRDIWSCGSSLSIPTEEDYERIKKNNAINKALRIIEKINKDNLDYDKALKIIEIFEGVRNDKGRNS